MVGEIVAKGSWSILESMNLELKKGSDTKPHLDIKPTQFIWYMFNRKGNHQIVCLDGCCPNI